MGNVVTCQVNKWRHKKWKEVNIISYQKHSYLILNLYILKLFILALMYNVQVCKLKDYTDDERLLMMITDERLADDKSVGSEYMYML